MKKIALFVAVLIFSLVSSQVYAHPPSDINITFDSNTKILQAQMIHGTGNPMKHYINKVHIALNNKVIIEHKISLQDNNQSQSVSYFIPDVKSGDIISVAGYCNLSGKLTKKIEAK
jgi:hypothetical protein